MCAFFITQDKLPSATWTQTRRHPRPKHGGQGQKTPWPWTKTRRPWTKRWCHCLAHFLHWLHIVVPWRHLFVHERCVFVHRHHFFVHGCPIFVQDRLFCFPWTSCFCPWALYFCPICVQAGAVLDHLTYYLDLRRKPNKKANYLYICVLFICDVFFTKGFL